MMMMTMTKTMMMMEIMMTMMMMIYGNLPGPAFAQFPQSIARLRPESAQFHLIYRINHFPQCNFKGTHKLKLVQYDLGKTSFIEKYYSGLKRGKVWVLFDDLATVGLREEWNLITGSQTYFAVR